MTPLFPELPDHARVRVFHAERSLTKDEEKGVASVMDAFVAQWTAHQAAVLGRWALLESRFIVVAVDETRTALTGCSKDSLVRAVRAAEGAARCAFVGAPPVAFIDGGAVRTVGRDEFADLARSGKVSLDTIVFDETIETLGDIRAGRFRTAARHAWHARAFDFMVGA